MNKEEYVRQFKEHQKTCRIYADRLEDYVGVKVSDELMSLMRLIVLEFQDMNGLLLESMKEGGVNNGSWKALKTAMDKMDKNNGV